MPKFVHLKGSRDILIQFQCNECNKQFITTFDDFGKSFRCPGCSARVNTLPVMCIYEGCGGRFEKCGGTIRKLSPKELAVEEHVTDDSELDVTVGARPTDSYHENMGNIRGSIITYKCDRCGDPFTAAYGSSHQFDHTEVICERIICSFCKRPPNAQHLPEPEGHPSNTPLQRWQD